MARLMLSAGMFSALAAWMAVRRRGFLSGSPPLLAAMLISLMRRVKVLPRLASSAPFLCLMVAHLEWPDIEDLVARNAWIYQRLRAHDPSWIAQNTAKPGRQSPIIARENSG